MLAVAFKNLQKNQEAEHQNENVEKIENILQGS